MMRSKLLALLVAVLPHAFAADEPGMVKLVSKDGKTIEVEVVSVGEKSAKIKKADGKEFEIAFSRLDAASVESLRKIAAEAAKNARPLPKGDPKSPADLPEKVVVKPGENLKFVFTEVTSGLTKPEIVKDAGKETPHFSVDFKERKEGDITTLAIVTSYYPKILRVKCLARNKGSDDYYPTSILPLHKGIFGGESWSDEVEELVFYDFAWADEKEK